ncbi:hypothetical protein PI172_2312 [Prevotella intermedia]|uniref:Uncharacterized protein n=1 Tax=Prevotella intermedia TaxID=28131 RepID=A0AAD1F892_PREIN|nr:hypothetical protein PI172_2312 [Prevotella intermedia]
MSHLSKSYFFVDWNTKAISHFIVFCMCIGFFFQRLGEYIINMQIY